MITITNKKYWSKDFYNADSGVSYLNANVGDRVKCEIDFYVSWDLTKAFLNFDSATKSIQIITNLEYRSFVSQGFQEGDAITITGTSSNNGNFTITEISNDGLKATVAESITDEKETSGNIYGVTPITAIEFLYNLLPSGSASSFVSLTDNQTKQLYTADNIDASDVIHTNEFKVGTKSFGWVTNEAVYSTAIDSGVTIIGKGVSNYQQKFTITQYFIVTPTWLTSFFTNFNTDSAPTLFPLGHIFQINAKFDSNSPLADHSGEYVSINGGGSWFDQTTGGKRAAYYIDGVTYTDHNTSETLTTLDPEKTVDVAVTVKSLTAKFVNDTGRSDGTIFTGGFFICPSNQSQYQNTQTTFRENLFSDYAVNRCGLAQTPGDFNGTSYQAITAFRVVFVNDYQVTVNFRIAPGTGLKTYWESLADNQRYYTLFISTQDISITSSKNIDRVSMLADFKSALYDTTDSTLVGWSDAIGAKVFQYPDNGTYYAGDINGVEGDSYFVKFPPYIETKDGAKIKTIAFQVVAQKTGKTDFIFEETKFDCSQFPIVDSKQLIDIDATRGFTTYADDPRNSVIIARDPSSDSGTKIAYSLQYGFVLRYEDWISALPISNTDVATLPDIAKDFESITHRWSNYSGVNGWSFLFRMLITAEDAKGNETPFKSDINMTIAATNEIIGDWSAYSQEVKFYLEDESEEIASFDRDGTTLIRATFTGDYTIPSGANGRYGIMFSDITTGSQFTRRFASTEIDSEGDSPFSAPDADPLADSSYANGNLRMDIFNGVKVVVSAYFDLSMVDIYDALTSKIQLYCRLGATYDMT